MWWLPPLIISHPVPLYKFNYNKGSHELEVKLKAVVHQHIYESFLVNLTQCELRFGPGCSVTSFIHSLCQPGTVHSLINCYCSFSWAVLQAVLLLYYILEIPSTLINIISYIHVRQGCLLLKCYSRTHFW